MRRFSIIIPVYNRPEEVKELLQSLTQQTYKNFEVLIVEDGSQHLCDNVVALFKGQLEVHYYYKENSGQGFSRNFGYQRASGDYLVVFDSDCIIPENYFETVNDYLNTNYLDAYGGPDRAHPSFNALQKAISYSMTSMFTTGGIRGRKKHAGVFHPRSFNMGFSRQVYEKTKGYIITRMGEDIELSIRIQKSGFKTGLIEAAFVYHKRRTDLIQFFKQLHFFGRARINIFRFFPSELRLVHFLPALFTIGLFIYFMLFITDSDMFVPATYLLSLYLLLILIDAGISNRSFKIGLLSVLTSLVQLTGYGVGFISECLRYLNGDRSGKPKKNEISER